MMPESFEYAKNGGRKYLFRNLGDGSFDEVSQKLGIDTPPDAIPADVADTFPSSSLTPGYVWPDLACTHSAGGGPGGPGPGRGTHQPPREEPEAEPASEAPAASE